MSWKSRGLAGLLVLISCLSWLPTTAHAENYAFLVAVQDYNVKSLRPLKFTRNDIQEFSKVLQASGFKHENIVLMTDEPKQLRYAAEADKIRKQLDTLLAGLEERDTLIVAFAGHGVQFEGDARNYFCPADAEFDDPKRARLVAISEIYEKLKACPAQRKLLVVDACRKDPLTELGRSREVVRLKSLTRPQTEAVPKGVVALFSCAAGQEAFEWPEYKHGIFFHHFLEGWRGAAAKGEAQVTLDQVVAYAKQKTQTFARVNLDVPQTPQLKSDFEGTWVLRTFEKVAGEAAVRIEFRRAEAEPAEGLTEAVIPGTTDKIYLYKLADVTNADIAKARSILDDQQKPAAEITFTAAGAKKMAKISELQIGKPLAIIIDGKVISAPVVRSPFSERAMISGNFTVKDVEKIVKRINGD